MLHVSRQVSGEETSTASASVDDDLISISFPTIRLQHQPFVTHSTLVRLVKEQQNLRLSRLSKSPSQAKAHATTTQSSLGHFGYRVRVLVQSFRCLRRPAQPHSETRIATTLLTSRFSSTTFISYFPRLLPPRAGRVRSLSGESALVGRCAHAEGHQSQAAQEESELAGVQIFLQSPGSGSARRGLARSGGGRGSSSPVVAREDSRQDHASMIDIYCFFCFSLAARQSFQHRVIVSRYFVLPSATLPLPIN